MSDPDVVHPDHGFTHIALQVSDLDRSLSFYERYADMTPVHRRTSSDGVRVAWITDHTRPFVIVLLETRVTAPRGGSAPPFARERTISSVSARGDSPEPARPTTLPSFGSHSIT